MVETVRQLCIESHTVTDEENTSFTMIQGKDYLTTIPKHDDISITVFSRYWVKAPKHKFVKLENY